MIAHLFSRLHVQLLWHLLYTHSGLMASLGSRGGQGPVSTHMDPPPPPDATALSITDLLRNHQGELALGAREKSPWCDGDQGLAISSSAPLVPCVTHREVPEALQSSTRDMRVLGSLQTKTFCLSSLAASFMTQLQCHVMSVVWLSPRPTARSLTAPTSL